MTAIVTILCYCGCGFKTEPITPDFMALEQAKAHVEKTGHKVKIEGHIERHFPKD